jgi:polyisoprenoid-binding protein YceI
MMKTKISYRKTFLFALVGLLISVASVAQSGKKTGTFDIVVKGSSNLHNWTMKAAGGGIDAHFTMNPGVAHIAGIPSLSFTMPVKNLKSNESLMDSRTYTALKADKNPNISYKVVSASVSGAEQNKSQLNVTGVLTIAGVSRQLTMPASAVANSDGSVVVSGSKTIKMSEFGIKPPTFMLGALKVTDNVTIEYSARFK